MNQENKAISMKESRFISEEINPKAPVGLMKIRNIKTAKILADLRDVGISEIKYRGENKKLIPIKVSLEEMFKIAKIRAFSNKLQGGKWIT